VSLIKSTVKSGSREVQKNYFIIFGHSCKFFTNFISLKQFLKFKTIEKQFKITTQCRAEIRPAATVRSVAACPTWPIGRPAWPRPGGLVVASRRQGSRLEQHRHAANVLSKESRGGAHRGGGATMGRSSGSVQQHVMVSSTEGGLGR
jgi:hypothetical protein